LQPHDLRELGGPRRIGTQVLRAAQEQLFLHPAQVALGGACSKDDQGQAREYPTDRPSHGWRRVVPPAVTSNSARRFWNQESSS
jgi:hypothetical protein